MRMLDIFTSLLDMEPADITVWAGDYNVKVADGESNHSVCGITQHAQYQNEPPFANDIAILHLCQPITFSKGKFPKE